MEPKYLLISALLFGLALGAVAQSAPTDPPISAAAKADVDPGAGTEIEIQLRVPGSGRAHVRRRSTQTPPSGAYANANTSKEFAKLLTEDLRALGQRPAPGRCAMRSGRDRSSHAGRDAESASIGEDARRGHSRWLRHRARRAAPRQCRLPRRARLRPHGNGRRCVYVRDGAARRHRCADPGPAPQRWRRTEQRRLAR